MRFPPKITSSCIWVAIPVDLVILHSIWYACGADGRRAVSVRSRDYQICLGWVVSLTHDAPLASASRERKLRYNRWMGL